MAALPLLPSRHAKRYRQTVELAKLLREAQRVIDGVPAAVGTGGHKGAWVFFDDYSAWGKCLRKLSKKIDKALGKR